MLRSTLARYDTARGLSFIRYNKHDRGSLLKVLLPEGSPEAELGTLACTLGPLGAAIEVDDEADGEADGDGDSSESEGHPGVMA